MFRKLPLFLRAMFSEWASGVTGAASAPMFLLGLYLENGVPKLLSEVFAFLLFLYATFAVWRREHDKLEATVIGQPKPSLLLTYDSPVITRTPDEATEPPLVIHNDAPLAAVNIRSERVIFNRVYSMQIRDIQMIGPYAHLSAAFDVEWRLDDGCHILETPQNLAAIVFRAREVGRQISVPTVGPWPIVLNYIDANQRQFRREYEMAVDVMSRRITLTFKQ